MIPLTSEAELTVAVVMVVSLLLAVFWKVAWKVTLPFTVTKPKVPVAIVKER